MHLTTVDMSLELLLAPILDEAVLRGHEVIGVSAPGPFVERVEARGVRHVALPSSTRRFDLLADLKTALEFWRVVRRERPDVLHTHNPKPGLYGRVLGRLAGVPVVVNTVHGLYASPDDRPVKRAVVYAAEFVGGHFSHAELVHNPEDLGLMRRLRLAPRRNLHLLGSGVAIKRFANPHAERSAALRAEWGIAPDEVLIGTVGRLVAEKGIPELLEATRGLSGARLILYPPAASTFVAEENIIIGNVAFYGATAGEAFIRGMAGERFGVRNSGVTAVVEGVGDHGCEYMTGGTVVILGATGRNFAAGMSGGVAYVLDEKGDFPKKCNQQMVALEQLDDEDTATLKGLIEEHAINTKSTRAAKILSNWDAMRAKFIKVMPKDYKRVLQEIKKAQAAGLTGDDALNAAFEANSKDAARVGGG